MSAMLFLDSSFEFSKGNNYAGCHFYWIGKTCPFSLSLSPQLPIEVIQYYTVLNWVLIWVGVHLPFSDFEPLYNLQFPIIFSDIGPLNHHFSGLQDYPAHFKTIDNFFFSLQKFLLTLPFQFPPYTVQQIPICELVTSCHSGHLVQPTIMRTIQHLLKTSKEGKTTISLGRFSTFERSYHQNSFESNVVGTT